MILSPVHFEKIARAFLTAGPNAEKAPQSPTQTIILMFALIAVSFYFIVLRPQKKEQDSRKKLLEQLKKGDEVVTIGGIFGTVVETDNEQNSVTLEVAKNIRIRFLKSAIANVINKS